MESEQFVLSNNGKHSLQYKNHKEANQTENADVHCSGKSEKIKIYIGNRTTCTLQYLDKFITMHKHNYSYQTGNVWRVVITKILRKTKTWKSNSLNTLQQQDKFTSIHKTQLKLSNRGCWCLLVRCNWRKKLKNWKPTFITIHKKNWKIWKFKIVESEQLVLCNVWKSSLPQ